MASSTIRYVVRFSGRVQGVGFRFTTLEQARGLNVHGFVRNEPDGSVEMDVEGSSKDLKELVRRIESAMSGNIDATDIDQRPTRGIDSGFHIQH